MNRSYFANLKVVHGALARSLSLLAFLCITSTHTMVSPVGAAESQNQVAVITFHQYRYDKFASEYVLRIYGDGTVLYEGLSNVKTKGQRRFHVPEHRVRDAVIAIIRLGVFERKSQVPPSGPGNRKFSAIEVRTADLNVSSTITQSALSPAYAHMLVTLEEAFPTKALRCPYYSGSDDPMRPSEMPGRSIEVCDFMDLRHYFGPANGKNQ